MAVGAADVYAEHQQAERLKGEEDVLLHATQGHRILQTLVNVKHAVPKLQRKKSKRFITNRCDSSSRGALIATRS